MKLEVGKKYKRRDGNIVTIVEMNRNWTDYPYVSEEGLSYKSNGTWWSEATKDNRDIIAEYRESEVGGSDMTDYRSIIEDDSDFSTNPKRSCSTSNHFGSFLGHLQALRDVLKAAGQDGFCLDELMNALPEFEKAIQNK